METLPVFTLLENMLSPVRWFGSTQKDVVYHETGKDALAKPDDLSLTLKTYKVEGENSLPQAVF